MYSISANRNRVAYDIKSFVVDSTSDIQTLPTNCATGSTAFVISDSTRYMLNSNKEWKQVNLGGNTGGGGGSGGTTTEIIYDGGMI